MAIESTYKDYQRRKAREKDRDNTEDDYGPRPPQGPQFQPRAIKVKKEPKDEMDFATRMKMMSKGKASLKKSVFGIKKEEIEIKEEPGLKKKKKRRKRYDSYHMTHYMTHQINILDIPHRKIQKKKIEESQEKPRKNWDYR